MQIAQELANTDDTLSVRHLFQNIQLLERWGLIHPAPIFPYMPASLPSLLHFQSCSPRPDFSLTSRYPYDPAKTETLSLKTGPQVKYKKI